MFRRLTKNSTAASLPAAGHRVWTRDAVLVNQVAITLMQGVIRQTPIGTRAMAACPDDEPLSGSYAPIALGIGEMGVVATHRRWQPYR